MEYKQLLHHLVDVARWHEETERDAAHACIEETFADLCVPDMPGTEEINV